MMHQYYILHRSHQVAAVFEFIARHLLKCEVHANRTRFWVPEGPVLTEFLLVCSDHCARVDATLDLATGHARWD
jgi:hypothetical protein